MGRSVEQEKELIEFSEKERRKSMTHQTDERIREKTLEIELEVKNQIDTIEVKLGGGYGSNIKYCGEYNKEKIEDLKKEYKEIIKIDEEKTVD